MKQNQKGFANIILVAVIVGLIGVVGFFMLQNSQLKEEQIEIQPASKSGSSFPSLTTDPTTNWSLHSFSDFGLSFSYPEDASVEEENRIDGLVAIVSTNKATMTIKPNQSGLGFENPDLEITQSSLLIDGKQLQLANSNIKKTTIFNTVEKTTSYMIIVPYPGQKSYSIMVTYEFSNGIVDESSNNFFDQILSTFKFTE